MTEATVYYYEDKEGHLCKGFRPETEEGLCTDYSWEGLHVLYRLKGITKGGKTEVSESTSFYNQIRKKKAFWEKTNYYKKVVIQKRTLSEWKDE